jgi:hypothetical protein
MFCNAGSAQGENQKNELLSIMEIVPFRIKLMSITCGYWNYYAAFVDYDKDGDLDVYILNNSFIPVSSLNYSNKRELRDKDWDVASILKEAEISC